MHAGHFDEFDLAHALCIPSEELHIGGKFKLDTYQAAVVAIHKCDSSERTCANDVADYFSKMTWSIIVEDNGVNYNEYENPIISNLSMVSFTHLYGISDIEEETVRYDESLSLMPAVFKDAND